MDKLLDAFLHKTKTVDVVHLHQKCLSKDLLMDSVKMRNDSLLICDAEQQSNDRQEENKVCKETQ